MLITISGVDGCGKSTQIAMLDDALRRRGGRGRVLWYRPGYSRELDAIRRAVRRAAPSALPKAGPNADRTRVFAKPGVTVGWTAVAAVDMLVQYGIKLRAAVHRDDYVICDRYLADAMLDLEARLPGHAGGLQAAHRLFGPLCPTPDISLLITLSTDEMWRRAEAKEEPFPDPPDVRMARYRRYQAMADSGAFVVIDGEGSPQAVHSRLLEAVDLATARAAA